MPERGATAEEELAYRLRQQELVAQLGIRALKARKLLPLLDEAVRITAAGLNSSFCKVAEYLPAENRLLIRAGIGWRDGVVGKATVGADMESPAGYALHTGKPVISNHLAAEQRFRTPALFLDHGIKRAINVVISDGDGDDEPFGVLEVDSTERGRFTDHDLAFMQAVANTLGTAIMRLKAEEIGLRHEREAMEAHAQKMEAIGRNAGIIAHDFNNILQAIVGPLSRLEATAMDRPHLQRYVSIALRAADQGMRMASSLLAFSRPQRFEPRIVDVNAILAEMSDSVLQILGPGIELRQRLAPDLRPVFVDPDGFERAILNLVVNAADAMPKTGALIIETSNTGPAQPDTGAAGERAAAYVRIVVRDTGIGMSPEVRKRLFEPFFTTKPSGKGTGLGLAQVYGFVTQSQGRITVDSAEGKGTEVSLYLPQVESRS